MLTFLYWQLTDLIWNTITLFDVSGKVFSQTLEHLTNLEGDEVTLLINTLELTLST